VGAEPPASRPNLVRTYVTRLRRALADDPAITTDGPGYRLVADHRQLDVYAFHRHADAGELAADAGELAAALDCWRGPVLADEPGLRQHPAAVGNMDLQVRTHNDLAGGYLSLGRADEAERHLRRALELFESLGDPTGEAGCHLNLALVLTGLGRHREALDHDRRGLALFRRTGSLFGQASALNAIGGELAHLGDLETALDHCEQALALHQRIGPSSGLADVWDSLGLVHRGLGHPDEALSCYEKAARAAGEVGTRYKQATAMVSLGDVCQEVGKTGRARSAWHHALAILEDLNHPEAEQVRARTSASLPYSVSRRLSRMASGSNGRLSST
jgi:tetratricopeptide (TPR) repeat protein